MEGGRWDGQKTTLTAVGAVTMLFPKSTVVAYAVAKMWYSPRCNCCDAQSGFHVALPGFPP